MKAYEFPSRVTKTGDLTIPARLRKQLSARRAVKVIVLIPEGEDEDKEWSQTVAEQFFKDDDPADAVYDKLYK